MKREGGERRGGRGGRGGGEVMEWWGVVPVVGGPGECVSGPKWERSPVGGSPIGAVPVEANISRFFFRLSTPISFFFSIW